MDQSAMKGQESLETNDRERFCHVDKGFPQEGQESLHAERSNVFISSKTLKGFSSRVLCSLVFGKKKKGQESLETKDRERGSTISVEGYDSSVHEYPLELALTKHFASCGKIQCFHIFEDSKWRLKSPLFISFWKEEEGAVDKALQLSGSDVGGWNAVVKAAPRPEYDCNPHVGNLCRRERDLLFSVYEIPSSLSEIDVKIGLCNLFSSCGEVTGVFIYAHIDNQCEAVISFVGKGCVDKAQELMNGQSIHSKDGWNIALTKVFPPMPKSIRMPTGFLNPLFKEAKIDKGKQKMQKKTTEMKKKQKKITEMKKKQKKKTSE